MNLTEVKKSYKFYSPIYNLFFKSCFNPGRKSAVNIINNELNIGKEILEVGVGTGLSLPLYDSRFNITGIDISGEMLSRAKELVTKQKLSNVKNLFEMDAEKLTFQDNLFDTVVAMYVASVVPSLDNFMKEMIRVCKPGGNIIIVNHFASKNRVVNSVEQKMSKKPHVFGFNANFPIEPILSYDELHLVSKAKINMFKYWTLLRFVNHKKDLTSNIH